MLKNGYKVICVSLKKRVRRNESEEEEGQSSESVSPLISHSMALQCVDIARLYG